MPQPPSPLDQAFADNGLPPHVCLVNGHVTLTAPFPAQERDAQRAEVQAAIARFLVGCGFSGVSFGLTVRHYKPFSEVERTRLEAAVEHVLGHPVSLAEDLAVAGALRHLRFDVP